MSPSVFPADLLSPGLGIPGSPANQAPGETVHLPGFPAMFVPAIPSARSLQAMLTSSIGTAIVALGTVVFVLLSGPWYYGRRVALQVRVRERLDG